MVDDDVLNLERLVEAFDDDEPSIATMLTLARETERRYIGALRDAMSASDIVAVSRAAHSIKGSASNIGADRVSRAAAAIEDRARAGSWDGVAGFADELDATYLELCERIAHYAGRVAKHG